MLCYYNPSCNYWTWIPEETPPICNLMSVLGYTFYQPGAISGGKYCLSSKGNDSEPFQHFFPLFLTKSNKIHYKHDPTLTYCLLHVQLPLIQNWLYKNKNCTVVDSLYQFTWNSRSNWNWWKSMPRCVPSTLSS